MGRPSTREPIDENYEIFGKRLAELRKRLKLSQADLAKELGIAPSSIAEYERGTTRIQLGTIKLLSKFFNISVDDLLGIKTDKVANINNEDPLIVEIQKANLTKDEQSQIMDYAKFIMSKRE